MMLPRTKPPTLVKMSSLIKITRERRERGASR
jgi:hypothetical protein